MSSSLRCGLQGKGQTVVATHEHAAPSFGQHRIVRDADGDIELVGKCGAGAWRLARRLVLCASRHTDVHSTQYQGYSHIAGNACMVAFTSSFRLDTGMSATPADETSRAMRIVYGLMVSAVLPKPVIRILVAALRWKCGAA